MHRSIAFSLLLVFVCGCHLPNPEGVLHNNSGMRLLNEKRYRDAESEFKEAISLDPRDATAHNNLGLCLYHEKRFPESDRELREAIRLKDNMGIAHSNLALTLIAEKQIDDAIQEAIRATELIPNDSKAWNNLGYAQLMRADYMDAKTALDRSVAINPNAATAQSNLALADVMVGQDDAAHTAIDQALRLAPKNGFALGVYTRILIEERSFPEALKAATDGLKVAPDNPQLLDNAGVASFNMGQYADAEMYQKHALQVAPDDEADKLNLGNTLVKENKLVEAKPLLEDVSLHGTGKQKVLADKLLAQIPK